MEQINSINGGKAIDSGGFGCLFLPSLKCSNSANLQDKSFVSKLMLNKYSDEEYNLIQKFNYKLKSIPNYLDYFLLGNFELCHPSQLNSEDLINYDKKCSSLIESGINSDNVNTHLDKIKTINMPYGGINIRKFIINNFNSTELIKLNNSLINLLQNGIIPMNQLNVFHGDLKGSNMLADKQSDGSISVKIIDWGLSFIRENINEIPRNAIRPIQFNLPVSVVVFHHSIDGKLLKFISENPKWTPINCKIFTSDFLNEYTKKNDQSHLKILVRMIDNFNSLKNIVSRKFSKNPTNYILDYVSDVIYKYTVNGQFNKLAYLNEVYLKNMDIWGFLTIYLEFYEIIDNKEKLNSHDLAFLGKIKKIIMENLFLNSITPINIPNLINQLMDLNSSFPKIAPKTSVIGGNKYFFNKKKKSIRKKYNKKRKNYNTKKYDKKNNHKTRKNK